ncbi:MAG: M61 family metallopeptidase [Acidobacteriaceae bacterium]|nr:M61 family metallopeptidase [Acidobacteriaceae bacterium]
MKSFFVLLALTRLPVQASTPIQVSLDLTDAPRKLLHAHLTIPVHPGPLTLDYPQWIPGEHSPTGPIDNVAGIVFSTNGQTLPWRRDDVNMFALHLTVPDGIDRLDARVDFLATAAASGFSAGASTGPNLAIVSWNEVALYPDGAASSQVTFAPSLKVPEGWQFGTALTQSSSEASTIHFQPVSLEMLVDSPVLAGRFFREVPLAPEITPKHFLDMAADGPEDLNVTSTQIDAWSNLVRETGALYRSHHYNSYHFLVTLSENVAHFGLEHHQSSDDRLEARGLIDDDLAMLNGDLLPHEFTHSWNGKYRRPAGLATQNFGQPMKGDLLWVYEGLTQYLGDVLAARSGIWTAEQYRSYLAASAAEMDHRPGRTWRDLEDTAVSAQILYSTSPQWDNWRRSVDYYPEGELIWLDADTVIRKMSKGKKSLNDFCARFLGARGNTPPEVFPYDFDDLVSNLNAVQSNDWAAFLRERITSKSSHAPLAGITNGGYTIEYTDQPNEFTRAEESKDRGVNAWYSLGIHVADNTIDDVLIGSPADAVGLGPDMRIVAVNGRRTSDELLRRAVRDCKGQGPAVELIVENSGYFKTVKLDYHGGERYPHLTRQPAAPALLDDILKPMAKHEMRASSE